MKTSSAKSIITVALAIVITSGAQSYGSSAEPADTNPGFQDFQTESKLLYNKYFAKLKANETFNGAALFIVKVDGEGTGHLQTSITQADGHPREKADSTEINKQKVLKIWRVRISYPFQNGWKQLTLDDAKAFWGTPRKYTVREQDFYTFDAKNESGEEENIYHLDLRFDKNKILNAYRIRGIGITNPRWVTKREANLEEKAPNQPE